MFNLQLFTLQEEKAEPEGVAGLVTPLQQFMEGSSLGEYSVRLELLRAFLGQLTYMDDSTIKGKSNSPLIMKLDKWRELQRNFSVVPLGIPDRVGLLLY